jgi:monooxygenase
VGVQAQTVDVLVVGAGLSGICAAHTLRTQCPDLSFAMVEAREHLGGTWDLFRYPGIRSDSDMYTFGFSFRPWRDPKAIADGPAILKYLQETAADLGLQDVIRYGRRVEAASFRTSEARWTVTIRAASGEVETVRARFLWVCAGYYRYDAGHSPELPGRRRFTGQVVHPQQWPEGLDVTGKRVVVLGSGATAVTLVPTLAQTAANTVMLQRTPTWMVSLPSVDATAERLKRWLPPTVAHRVIRRKNVTTSTLFYRFCRRFPDAARRFLRRRLEEQVDAAALDAHFQPPYAPWDQRLCMVPDGDLFTAIRAGRARVVTGTIHTLTETGVELTSGEVLPADVLVTATGLELQFFGGAKVDVDGAPVDLPATRIYLGCMLSGVPNAAFVMGYTNASWTLKCELVCERLGRLLRHLRDGGYTSVVPVADPTVGDHPATELSSGYFQRALDRLPRQGDRDPWRLHQDWFVDRRLYRRRPLEDGVLRFGR